MCVIQDPCLTGGDLVVAGGIILTFGMALWSLVWSSRLHKKQNKLAEDQNRLAQEQNELLAEQNELARVQLESQPKMDYPLRPPTRYPHHARFEVTLTGGRSERLIIRNVGDDQAHSVTLELDPPDDLLGGSPQEFPRLDPGQEWRLPFARSLASPRRYHWQLTWTQGTGKEEQDGWVAPP